MDRRAFLKITAAGLLAGATQRLSAPFAAMAPPNVGADATISYSIADSHFHYADFLQKTEGVDALLQSMKAAGVDHIMFSGMPLVKKWDAAEPEEPKYYLDDNARAYWYSATDFVVARRFLELPSEVRSRFHPFICGFNATDKHAVMHVERMLAEYPGLWQGVGEVFGHRDDLTNLTYGETARANHPALDPIYDLAGQKNLPVNLHNNATSRNRLDKPIYVYEVQEALARHPKTVIIWAHAGLSRMLDLDQTAYTGLLREMLAKHDNLYIDLSWIIFENYVQTSSLEPRIRPEWLSLISDFSGRFMIGSDNIGHFATYNQNILKYYTLLDALKPDAARKVALTNFLGLLPQSGDDAHQGLMPYPS
ncbi:amidohydrolase family protein [Thiorhodovibrio frisius]|uniref:Putative TIM-barrel fold metal-dependent hydrolase n=1 Tax=Thiorhodovibrio frisius TaxID=631362 RepID=H8Z4W5_9GAMM|nr:amidohydrolase family protein [Thiorhodovibrio frisius]EIC20372.1 putative TIM-barrel fold metal-dependent hydrolase [Thiorhodovibrio frisius]WPL21112.1 putative metal-dependent hydrolase of the TIM-barrel fold protein [Thiorhodovibrio frisius]